MLRLAMGCLHGFENKDPCARWVCSVLGNAAKWFPQLGVLAITVPHWRADLARKGAPRRVAEQHGQRPASLSGQIWANCNETAVALQCLSLAVEIMDAVTDAERRPAQQQPWLMGPSAAAQ